MVPLPLVSPGLRVTVPTANSSSLVLEKEATLYTHRVGSLLAAVSAIKI